MAIASVYAKKRDVITELEFCNRTIALQKYVKDENLLKRAYLRRGLAFKEQKWAKLAVTDFETVL